RFPPGLASVASTGRIFHLLLPAQNPRNDEPGRERYRRRREWLLLCVLLHMIDNTLGRGSRLSRLLAQLTIAFSCFLSYALFGLRNAVRGPLDGAMRRVCDSVGRRRGGSWLPGIRSVSGRGGGVWFHVVIAPVLYSNYRVCRTVQGAALAAAWKQLSCHGTLEARGYRRNKVASGR